MDLAEATAPKSDQLNGDDLRVRPLTVTIKNVRITGGQQPVSIDLEEFPRPWKPCKTMLRVLMAPNVWGGDEKRWAGKRLTLYRNGDITFGDAKPGGIRVSHVSDIAKRETVHVTIAKGRTGPYTVEPLATSAPTSAPVSERDLLKAEWVNATPERRKEIEAEVQVIDNEPNGGPSDAA